MHSNTFQCTDEWHQWYTHGVSHGVTRGHHGFFECGHQLFEALISQLEVEQFGRNGDAGPFGCEPNSDPTYGDPPRTFVPRAIHAFQVLIR